MSAVAATDPGLDRFESFIDLIALAMGHADRYAPLRGYCTALLLPGDRKSIEPMAARINPANVRSQHQAFLGLISDSPWSDEEVLAAVQDYAVPPLLKASKHVAWLVDDTGVPKKGKHSVGVAKQYCGQLGKQENCQVAVTLSLANKFASLPIAHQIYLPEEWAADEERRTKAKVPDEVVFLTKPAIALRQVEQAYVTKLPRGPIVADAGYGNDSKFRAGITALELEYCVGIQGSTTVWPADIEPSPPIPYSGRGRPRTQRRRAPGHEPVSVKALAQSLPASSYSTVEWREGAKTTLSSRFAAVRVHPAHRDHKHPKTAAAEWLLIEWPIAESAPTKYWLSTLSETIPIKSLVRVAKLRWRIERDYQELKDEIGLDHYEGRGWRGFHHHATLCIASYAFLMVERLFSPSGQTDIQEKIRIPDFPDNYQPRGAARST